MVHRIVSAAAVCERYPGRMKVSSRRLLLFTVAVVAMVSLVVYAIVPFRSGSRTSGNHPVTTVSNTGTGRAKLSAGPGKKPASSSAAATSSSAKAKAKTSASAVAQASAAREPSPGTHAAAGTVAHPATQSAAGP